MAAKYVGLELAIKTTEEDFAQLGEKNWLGKLPLLDTAQGPVFQSNAILRYSTQPPKLSTIIVFIILSSIGSTRRLCGG